MMAKLKAALVDSLLSTHFHESPTTRIIDECAKVVRATPSAPLDHVSKRDSSIPEAGGTLAPLLAVRLGVCRALRPRLETRGQPQPSDMPAPRFIEYNPDL
ncbi:hypothetical protein FA13DRAFT_1735652 [Coprinellus micaceus]|uniref:Uncharacterized protein n=1 Tax=Coprinellus micaceus TaxID=71717 RepID=A0A4Y7T3C4_COPMI|nr:hypothetical protein FA13DRAFT_1735652 [Coprinellus micaceus]